MRDTEWWKGFITGICITLAGEAVVLIALLARAREWFINCFGPNGC